MDASAYNMCFDKEQLSILCANYDKRIDTLADENVKLRKAVATAIRVQAVLCRDADSSYCRDRCPLHRPESNDCLACDVIGLAQELGIEV